MLNGFDFTIGNCYTERVVRRTRGSRATKGKQMSKKVIVLTSTSQGERGQAGHKKVYEIIVDGNKVELRWGKAEETKRQTQTKWFSYGNDAYNFALEKKWAKVDKGYVVAYQAI
jgi:predicted DNA-binding WGR domain protein